MSVRRCVTCSKSLDNLYVIVLLVLVSINRVYVKECRFIWVRRASRGKFGVGQPLLAVGAGCVHRSNVELETDGTKGGGGMAFSPPLVAHLLWGQPVIPGVPTLGHIVIWKFRLRDYGE